MATRGLLHHPLHARPSSFVADSRFLLLRRCLFSHRGVNAFRCSFSSTPTSISVKSMNVEGRAGALVRAVDSPQVLLECSDSEAVEYVNRQSPGPMVEVDPVTVFRRIITERRASFATASAKKRADGATFMHSTGMQPFFAGRRWSDKSTIATALAILLLVLAAVAFFLRSRAGRDKKAELSSTEEKDSVDESVANVRHKLVDDSIQAPESILTAMTIGAASIGRSKGHSSSSLDSPNETNGNVIDTQSLNSTEPIAFEDVKTKGHGSPPFGQFSYNPSSMESLEGPNVGLDVKEGPWFGEAADDANSVDSSFEAASISEEVASEEMIANTLVSEISKSEMISEYPTLSNLVDGEFLGEVASGSVVTEEAFTSDGSLQVDNFQLKEPDDDAALAITNEISEKLERLIEQGSIPLYDDSSVVTELDSSKQDQLSGVNDYERAQESKVIHPDTPLQHDEMTLMNGSVGDVDGENDHVGSLDGGVLKAASFEPMAADLVNGQQQTEGSNLMAHQGSGAVAHSLTSDMANNSFEVDLREENKKALEAAVPALAVGVGTVGAILGVAGGLQVVGFAALANFFSQDVFWAQSRAEFFQELKGISNRQKLLDFLARRKILRTDEEEASL